MERLRIDSDGHWHIGTPTSEEQPSLSLEEMERAWGVTKSAQMPVDTGSFNHQYIPKIELPVGYIRYNVDGMEMFDGANWIPFKLPDPSGQFLRNEPKAKKRRALSSR